MCMRLREEKQKSPQSVGCFRLEKCQGGQSTDKRPWLFAELELVGGSRVTERCKTLIFCSPAAEELELGVSQQSIWVRGLGNACLVLFSTYCFCVQHPRAVMIRLRQG